MIHRESWGSIKEGNIESSDNQIKEEIKSYVSQDNLEFKSEVCIKRIEWDQDAMKF